MIKHKPIMDDSQGKKSKDLRLDEINLLKKKLEEEEEKSKGYLNRLKYLQADFENYKKRVEKEVNQKIQYSNRRLIRELLPIHDELEYAIEIGKARDKQSEGILEGIEMTLNKLYKALEDEGVHTIETKGKNFDPNLHEAVCKAESKEEEGMIVEEVRKGFTFKGSLLRSSKVKISIGKTEVAKEEVE